MATAYILEKKIKSDLKLSGVPEVITLKTGESVVFDKYNDQQDENDLFAIFHQAVEDGQSYPQETIDLPGFRNYFVSHDCFVIRSSETKQTIAGVYIKPNFPGRSSHIANYGTVVDKNYRGKGLGDILTAKVCLIAPQLGYLALYTNLVFVCNEASIKLCKRHGFVEVGRLPKAGRLKTLGYVDAIQFYKNLEES